MNTKIWGIIGGVALVLALLSPLVLGNSKKIEQLFEAAEMLYEHSDYKEAIAKYKEALEESKKFGARTESIDTDFTTLANFKIAQCYYELAEKTSDVRYYQTALIHIKEVVLDTQVAKHQEGLTYLWAENLYKIGNLDQAESKFSWLVERFPNSQWTEKAWYTIGNINTKQENYDEALRAFQKLIDTFPNSQWVSEALYTIGNIHYKQENYDEALRAFQKLIDTFPNFTSTEGLKDRIALLKHLLEDPNFLETEKMYKNASSLKQQERLLDAYQLYTGLITQFPDSKYVTNAYEGRAEIHLEAKAYVNARADYEAAIRYTTDKERKIELYEAYHSTYLVPVYANRKIQTEPTDKYFVDARLLRKEGRFLDAAEIYEQLTNSTLSAEDTIYALYWKGRCYYEAALTDQTLFSKSGDAFKKLIGDYENNSYAIRAYYYSTLIYNNWAENLGDQSKYQLVIDTVEKANTKYADSNDTTVQGWLSRMQELKEIADQELNDRPRPEPPEPPEPLDFSLTVLVKQGRVHLKQSELEEATKKTRQALKIAPNYLPARELLSEIKEAHYGRGWTFFDEGQYDKAITEFKNAINIDSNFKEAHCHLGVIYIEQQKYTEAIQAFEKAISIDEAFKEAHFNLALAHLELGEFEEATYAANAALNIDPYYEPADILIKLIAD